MPYNDNLPDISPLIRKWHPDATDAELRTYTYEFRGFLKVLYEVFERLDREGELEELEKELKANQVKKKNKKTAEIPLK